ncbi:hypothetical protein ACFWF7_11135 [Nocardia sp. NPDC060256]|uniref:hypothetical protein n=1 Tax=unclassified Nocardia TaxID=2637762 RepID=UPI0036586B9B
MRLAGTDIDLDADIDEGKPNVLAIRGGLLAALTLTATVFLGAPATHADVDYDEATEQRIAAGVLNFRCKDKGDLDVIVVPLDDEPEYTGAVVVDDNGKPFLDHGDVIKVDLVDVNVADPKPYERDGLGSKERTQAWYARQVDIERSYSPYALKGGGSAEDSARQDLYRDNKYNPATRRQICGDVQKYSNRVTDFIRARKGDIKDCCATEVGLAKFLKDKMRAFSENDKKEALGVYKKEGSPLVKASE